MTVRLVGTVQVYQGGSWDIKPADAPEGSTFHDVDTGEQWVMHDGTWEKDKRQK